MGHHIENKPGGKDYSIVVGCDKCGDEGVRFINLWIIGIAVCWRCKRIQMYRRLTDFFPMIHKKFVDTWWVR